MAGLITQNVDSLHERAGSQNVIELHGALARVKSLSCGWQEHRNDTQARIEAANPQYKREWPEVFAPDGDADLDHNNEAATLEGFIVPPCLKCGGVMMPDVVFFGGKVSEAVTAAAWRCLDAADALLVVGTSLAVWSSFRFARAAAEQGKPVVILNAGPTRADNLAAVRLDAPTGEALPALAAALVGG